jgi:hypothetical protein
MQRTAHAAILLLLRKKKGFLHFSTHALAIFTVSAAASRRHVDVSLDLFARKSPRSWRDLAEKRDLSARRPLFSAFFL